MRQIFHPYYEWEDYQSGMYDELKEGRENRVHMAIVLLSNCMTLHKFMEEVTVRWKMATEVVFTDNKRNKKSWLGQAACCLFAGVKEDETREAWKYLSDEQRDKANATASKIIEEWVREYEQSNVRDECTRSSATTY